MAEKYDEEDYGADGAADGDNMSNNRFSNNGFNAGDESESKYQVSCNSWCVRNNVLGRYTAL